MKHFFSFLARHDSLRQRGLASASASVVKSNLKHMKFAASLAALSGLSMLSGCVVMPYEPYAVGGSTGAIYAQSGPGGSVAYSAPYPVYAAPPPVYAGPPVFFNFSYRNRGHGHGHGPWAPGYGYGRRGGHYGHRH